MPARMIKMWAEWGRARGDHPLYVDMRRSYLLGMFSSCCKENLVRDQFPVWVFMGTSVGFVTKIPRNVLFFAIVAMFFEIMLNRGQKKRQTTFSCVKTIRKQLVDASKRSANNL
jgi:hypothetical protein